MGYIQATVILQNYQLDLDIDLIFFHQSLMILVTATIFQIKFTYLNLTSHNVLKPVYMWTLTKWIISSQKWRILQIPSEGRSKSPLVT